MDNPTEVSSESAATFSFLGHCDRLGTSMWRKWDEKFLLQDQTSFTSLNAAEKDQGGMWLFFSHIWDEKYSSEVSVTDIRGQSQTLIAPVE